MREYADPRRHDLGKFGPGDDRYHAMRFLCSFDGDFDNTSMGVRRTYKSDLHHARQRYVADILSAPLRQTLQIWPRHRTADVRVRPVERSQDGRGVFGDLHWAANLIKIGLATKSFATYVPKGCCRGRGLPWAV